MTTISVYNVTVAVYIHYATLLYCLVILQLRRSLNVVQLQYEWPTNSVPENVDNLLELVAKTRASRTSMQGKTTPVLVHCR